MINVLAYQISWCIFFVLGSASDVVRSRPALDHSVCPYLSVMLLLHLRTHSVLSTHKRQIRMCNSRWSRNSGKGERSY